MFETHKMKHRSVMLYIVFIISTILFAQEQTPTKFAAVQFPVEGNKTLQQFLEKFENYVVEAKNNKAEVVIFPELCSFDTWRFGTKLSDQQISQQIASEVTPQFFTKVAEWSQKHNIVIFAGSSPNLKEDGIYNTALIAFPDGKLFYQDKLFLTHWEKDMEWKTGNELQIISAPWGKSVVLICYDVEFPVISHLLAQHTPELLLVPSMTEDVHGLHRVRWTAQARAIEHHAYVIVTGTVERMSEDWDNVGQAVFITPSEKGFPRILQSGSLNAAEVVYGTYNFQKLRKSRDHASHLYPAKDQLQRPAITIK